MATLEDALDCVHYHEIKEKYTVRPGMNSELMRIANELVESETSFEPDEFRLSRQTIVNSFRDLILQLAEDLNEADDPDKEEMFREKKADLLRDLLSGDLRTYSLVFPLNLRPRDSIPDSFTTSETTIERISEEEWRNTYEQPALESDKTSLSRFLEESPNDVYKADGYGGVFTYWKMECDARDSEYALYLSAEIVQIWLSKLNYSIKKKEVFVSQPANSKFPPNERMSQLREPFIYLIFEDKDYVEYRPVDYGLRRHTAAAKSQIQERMDMYNELPDLCADPEQLSGVDKTIVNALIAYQDGITESSIRQSFFAFWRGIEMLAQVNRDEPKKRARDRARFALVDVLDREPVRPEFDTAIENIYDTRNTLAHDGPHVSISEYDRSAAKVLHEALLELYFSLYSEGYTDEDYRLLLKYGVMSSTGRDKKRNRLLRSTEILEKVQEVVQD